MGYLTVAVCDYQAVFKASIQGPQLGDVDGPHTRRQGPHTGGSTYLNAVELVAGLLILAVVRPVIA